MNWYYAILIDMYSFSVCIRAISLSFSDSFTLAGTNVTYSARRTQEHTPLPTGTMSVQYTSSALTQTATVLDYAASALTVQKALQAMSSEIRVSGV